MTPQEYIERIAASGVLTADEVNAVVAKLPPNERPRDVSQLGRALVQKGLLTRYQAAAIFQNQARHLVLGNYVLLEKIGAGGMGEVFKARHRVMDRTVAIKVLPASLIGSPEAIKRFQREVRAAARLIHPHIVTAFDAAEDKGVHFLAMEYVEGEDLAKIVDRDGPLPLTDAVDYVVQAADGLAYAHAQGMIHRDIKPHNLLLASSGRKSPDSSTTNRPERVVKILDMGLARFDTVVPGESTERHSITREDQIIGTVDYMSPEQAESNRTVDGRSDIYSLGCTFFRLLTGQVPYAGDTAIRKLIAHRESPIPVLKKLRPELPAGLQDVFNRMMAKRPEDRWQSMQEVIAALRPFGSASSTTAKEPIAAEADSVMEDSAFANFIQRLPASSAVGRHPTAEKPAPPVAAPPGALPPKPSAAPTQRVALQQSKQDTARVERGRRTARGALPTKVNLLICLAIAGGVIFLVVAGLIVAFLASPPPPPQLVIEWPQAERTGAHLSINGQEMSIPDVETLEFSVEAGSIELAAARRGFEPVHQSFDLQDGERRVVKFEWQAVPPLGTVPTFDPPAVTLPQFDFQLNEKWPPFFTQQTAKKKTDATSRLAALEKLKSAVDAAAKAPGDAQVASAARLAASDFVLRYGSTPEAGMAGAQLARLSAPSDSLDRKDIPPHELIEAGVAGSADAGTPLVAVLGDSRLLSNDTVQYAVAFSRDNRLFATAGRSRIVTVWDATTQDKKWSLTGHTADVRALAFSPTADLLASSGLDRRIRLWNMATGENTLTLLSNESMNVYSLAFSPDGRWLASGSSDGLLRIWDVATGQRREELSGHTGYLAALAFSRDGKAIASSTDKGEVKIWNTTTWKPQAEISADAVPVYSLAFHPERDEVVGGLSNGKLLVWDSSGKLLRSFDQKPGAIMSLCFAPKGAQLIAAQSNQCRIWNYENATVDTEFTTGGVYLASSPDGKVLASCSTGSADIRLWTPTGQPLFDRKGQGGAVLAVAFTPDGERVVSGGQDNTVRIWEIGPRRLQHTLRGHTDQIMALACSPDGKLLASASMDKSIRIWNLATTTELPKLAGHSAGVYAVVFSPDGQQIASAGADNMVRIWDTELGIEKHLLSGHIQPVLAVAYSSDGLWLASASQNGEVRVWSASDGQARLVINQHVGAARAVEFSPDGRWLASAGDDREVLLFELATGKKHASCVGHSYPIRSIAFTPDSKLLVSCTASPTDKPGEMMIWDVESQIARRRLQGPLGEIFCATVDPLGRYIATAHRNGTVEILRAASRAATSPTGK